MKKFLTQYAWLLAVALMVVSCDDNPGDDELDGRQPAKPLVFTANVDGDEWTATSATASYSYNCDLFIVDAMASNGTSIQLYFEDIEPGSYPISAVSASFLSFTDEFGSVFSSANSPAGDNNVGSLNLASFDAEGESAEGSFGGSVYFGGSLFMSITNGNFEDISFVTDMESQDCDIDGPEYPETLVSWRLNDFERSTNNLVNDNSDEETIALDFATAAGDQVAFVFDKEIEPGAYLILDDNEASASFLVENVVQYTTGGSITIIHHDMEANYLHGVFDATMVAAVTGENNTISEGEFFINY